MSKMSRVDAVALVNDYDSKVRKLIPENKYRDVAVETVRQSIATPATGPLSINALNYVRLVKTYLPELTGKLGAATVHELFTTAVHLLPTPQVNWDVQKAIKRARVNYDKCGRKMSEVLRLKVA